MEQAIQEGTKEFNSVKKLWEKKSREVTVDTLPDFLKELTKKYTHDYGTICHAIAIASVAAAWAMNKSPQGGITGFQAGAVMWEFIKGWNHASNKTGLKLVDYDNFLYPQYSDQFQKTISAPVWQNIQREAAKNIDDVNANNFIANSVYQHWQKIVDGVVPFGYKVADE